VESLLTFTTGPHLPLRSPLRSTRDGRLVNDPNRTHGFHCPELARPLPVPSGRDVQRRLMRTGERQPGGRAALRHPSHSAPGPWPLSTRAPRRFALRRAPLGMSDLGPGLRRCHPFLNPCHLRRCRLKKPRCSSALRHRLLHQDHRIRFPVAAGFALRGDRSAHPSSRSCAG